VIRKWKEKAVRAIEQFIGELGGKGEEAPALIRETAGLDWTSTAHTALPVPVFAAGAGAEHFAGLYDNTDIFHKLALLMGVD